MKKLLIVLLSTFLVHGKSNSQDTFQTNSKKEIMNLVDKHRDSLPEKNMVKIFEMNILPNTKDNQDIHFYFMPNRVLRFYVISEDIDVQTQLWQWTEGILKKKNQKVLWEVHKKATNKGISFYDYFIEKENDFILKFNPLNSEGNGKAILVVVEITTKGNEFNNSPNNHGFFN